MHIGRQSLKQFIGLFIVGLLSYFMMNTANAYLVHVLGPVAYGDYALTLSLIFSLTPFFAVGTTTLLTKHLPLLIIEPSDAKKNIFMRWNTKTLKKSLVIITIILLIILLLRVTELNDIPCVFQHCEQYRHFIGDLHFLVPIALLLLWNGALLNATKHSVTANILGPARLSFVCAFIIFIAELFLTHLGHYEILMAIFISFLILCLCQYVAIYHFIIKPGELSLTAIKKQTVPQETRRYYIRSGLGLMTNSITYVALGLISMLMIEWLSPNEATLGHYVVVSKISSISTIIMGATSFLMIPFFSGLKDASRLKSLQSLINFQIGIGFAWLIIVLMAFFLFKPLIFTAYDIHFQHATWAICLLMVISYLFGIIGISESICLFNNMNKKLYPVTLFQIIFQGIACYFLIPRYSYLGAIYALGASELICAMICWFLARSHGIKIKILGLI